MATWEYYVETINISERWSPKKQQEEVERFRVRLNALGAQGWEMISYESVPLTGSFTNSIKGYAYLTFFSARGGRSYQFSRLSKGPTLNPADSATPRRRCRG
jgi:hypothetical protein